MQDDTPTRAGIEALVASVRPWDDYPVWARWPRGEAEFLASLVLHGQRGDTPPVTIGYDAFGRAEGVYGLRLKKDGQRSGAAATGVAA
jgi:hypothetical protein